MGNTNTRPDSGSTIIQVSPKKQKISETAKSIPLKKQKRNRSFEEVLADRLPVSEYVLYQAFNMFDMDQNGKIGLTDLEMFFKKYTGSSLHYDELRSMILDVSGSYELSFEDFRKLMSMDDSTFNLLLKVDKSGSDDEATDFRTAKKSSLLERTTFQSVSNLNDYEKPFVSWVKDSKLGQVSTLKRMKSVGSGAFSSLEKQYMEMEGAFSILDRDGKGFINAEDIRTAMNLFGLSSTSLDLQTLLRLVGKSGNDDHLSLNDFISLYAVCQESKTEETQNSSTNAPSSHGFSHTSNGISEQTVSTSYGKKMSKTTQSNGHKVRKTLSPVKAKHPTRMQGPIGARTACAPFHRREIQGAKVNKTYGSPPRSRIHQSPIRSEYRTRIR